MPPLSEIWGHVPRQLYGAGANADERLFICITSNRRHHSAAPLLPPQQEQHYLLRKRSHGYILPDPEHTSSLDDSNFLTRMLYKNINRFDDIVDIFLYIS